MGLFEWSIPFLCEKVSEMLHYILMGKRKKRAQEKGKEKGREKGKGEAQQKKGPKKPKSEQRR
jgi:hypothetical protein